MKPSIAEQILRFINNTDKGIVSKEDLMKRFDMDEKELSLPLGDLDSKNFISDMTNKRRRININGINWLNDLEIKRNQMLLQEKQVMFNKMLVGFTFILAMGVIINMAIGAIEHPVLANAVVLIMMLIIIMGMFIFYKMIKIL